MADSVSTTTLASDVFVKLNKRVSEEVILSLWSNLGSFVRTQLLQSKGVKLANLGTFTLNDDNSPKFVTGPELVNKFRVRDNSLPSSNNIPILAINYSQLAAPLNIPREQSEKVINHFLSLIVHYILEGRSVLITLRNLATITANQSSLKCDFSDGFLDEIDEIFHGNRLSMKQLNTSQNRVLNNTLRKSNSNTSMNNTTRANMNNRDFGDTYENKNLIHRNPISGDIIPSPNTLNGTSNRPSSSTGGYRSNTPQAPMSGRRGAGAGSYSNNRDSGGMSDIFNHNTSTTTTTTNNNRPMSSATTTRNNNNAASNNTSSGNSSSSSSSTSPLVMKLKQRIIERGGVQGIKTISRLLAIMDNNGDKRISKEEFKYGMIDYGITLTSTELDEIFNYFDRDFSQYIDLNEFLYGLQGELNDRRRHFIQLAFQTLDKDKSGEVTIDEIMQSYDFSYHPDVRAGKKTMNQAADEFIVGWEKGVNRDGKISYKEFEEYYKDISASIDKDDYFELMMRNAWHITGGEGWCANTANKRVLVTDKQGNQSVQTIHNDLGLKQGDVEGIRTRLSQQGINDSGNIQTHGGIDTRPQGSKFQERPRGGNTTTTSNNNRSMNRPSSAGSVQNNNWLNNNNNNVNANRNNNNTTTRNASNSINNVSNNNNTNNNSSSSGQLSYQEFDPQVTVRKILYTPPCSIETLANKLSVSIAMSNPRIMQTAFLNRIQSLDASLNKNQLAMIWKLLDPSNIKSISLDNLYIYLSTRFGQDKASANKNGNHSVIDRVKAKILERCGLNGGIKGLSRALSIMDNSGDKHLTKEELRNGLNDYGLQLNIREVDEIFSYFDHDKGGLIDFTEFIAGVRGSLNDRRKKFVKMAFDILDKDSNGEITIDEVKEVYDVSHHPDVKAGKITPREAYQQFMACFESSKQKRALISYADFEDYYRILSASIDGDDYFELMMRNAWHITGGKGWCANTANKRVLVTDRQGNQSVQTIHNDLGLKQGDVEGIRTRLAQQGLKDMGNIETHGGIDTRPQGSTFQRRRPSSSSGGGGGNNNTTMNRSLSNTKLTNRNNSSSSTNKSMIKTVNALSNTKLRSSLSLSNNNMAMTVGQLMQYSDENSPKPNFSSTAQQHTAYEKNNAASKLAAVFRGRKARLQVDQEKRKMEAQQRIQLDEIEEYNRPKPRTIIRPKGKSYIGF